MNETVQVRTLRMHHGDGGTRKEGDVYETTTQHAKQLGKLVEVLDAKSQPAPDNKAKPTPPNKNSPAPDNKGQPTPPDKAEAERAEAITSALAMADDSEVAFPTFKSAAVAILGADAPATKAELVAALKALQA